jgi:hypothetical protein
MTERAAIRIPFQVAVDCGFEGVCQARNISRSGIYIEAPRTEKALAVTPGAGIRLVLSSSGASATVEIQGTVARVEEIRMPDGSEGRGFGIQFKRLDDATIELIRRRINHHLDLQAAADIEELASTLHGHVESGTVPAEAWAQNGRRFLEGLPRLARERIRLAVRRAAGDPAPLAVGRAYLAELGIRCTVDIGREGDSEERRMILDRLRTYASGIQEELVILANALDIREHATQKEILEGVTRIAQAMRSANDALTAADLPAAPPVPMTEGPVDPLAQQFRPIEMYEEYVRTRQPPSGLDAGAAGLLSLLAEDWHKQVREHPALPEEADRLHKRAKALAFKLAFEGREVFRLRPLARNASAVLPPLREALAESLRIQQAIKEQAASAPAGSKDEFLCLERAASWLGGAAAEFEAFASSLPITAKAAGRYYEREHFRGLAEAPKPKGIVVRKPNRRVLAAVVSAAAVWGLVNFWPYVWGTMISFMGFGLGGELGVRDFSVRRGFWVGEVLSHDWVRIPPPDRLEKGNDVTRKAVARGFRGVEIRSEGGVLLGVSVRRDRTTEFQLVPTPEESRARALQAEERSAVIRKKHPDRFRNSAAPPPEATGDGSQ